MSGTYAGVQVLHPSLSVIKNFIALHKIPQCLLDKQDPRHATVIWSKKTCPSMTARPDDIHHARPKGLDVFISDNRNCLVILLDAPTLVHRHDYLMSEHDAVYGYPEYKPHVTIGYDIGSFSWWNLPAFAGDIILGNEEVRPGYQKAKLRQPLMRNMVNLNSVWRYDDSSILA